MAALRFKEIIVFLFFLVLLVIFSYPVFAGCPGCCSWHGGISNSCASSGRVICRDGTVSPSCSCASCGISTSTNSTSTLNIERSGEGTVTSNPTGINCGTDCSEKFTSGSTIYLYATPASGYEFTGWGGGACQDPQSLTCKMTLRYPQKVIASFAQVLSDDDGSQHPSGIEMFLETPAANETYTGVAFVRGWAVSLHGIEKVELHIDGNYVTDLPFGELRTAVSALYPDYPDSDKSGFNMAFQYSKLSTGNHTAIVRAFDRQGNHRDSSAEFNVIRFDTTAENNFLRDDSKIDLSGANITYRKNVVVIENMMVDGKPYDVEISWSILLQGMSVKKIQNSDD